MFFWLLPFGHVDFLKLLKESIFSFLFIDAVWERILFHFWEPVNSYKVVLGCSVCFFCVTSLEENCDSVLGVGKFVSATEQANHEGGHSSWAAVWFRLKSAWASEFCSSPWACSDVLLRPKKYYIILLAKSLGFSCLYIQQSSQVGYQIHALHNQNKAFIGWLYP